MMNVETVIVIPARGGSKNIPRKNLQLIKGKPLISYAIEIAHKVKLSNKVIVSTEDDEISEIGQQYGAEVIKRPHELAEDHINLLPVNQHVLKILESKNIYPKIIISLQPTAPFIEPTSIENAVRFQQETKCDSVCSISKVQHNHPYWVKKINPTSKKLSDFTNVRGDSFLQKQDLPVCYSYTGGFYIRKRNILKYHTGKGLGHDSRGYIVTEKESLDIDYPIDLEFFRFLMDRNQ